MPLIGRYLARYLDTYYSKFFSNTVKNYYGIRTTIFECCPTFFLPQTWINYYFYILNMSRWYLTQDIFSLPRVSS